jgi:demethylmenaquinone methyltransferase/2-methoxy-6-polyprenyl-1,4-benzoquinol methylase
MLETSQPSNRLIRFGFHLYVKGLDKPLANLISHTTGAYDFLATTMRRFYSAAELTEILQEAGFETGTSQPLLFGAAAIHTTRKQREG